jgi:hypothetical protein
MTSLERARDLSAITVDSGSVNLEAYRLGSSASLPEKRTIKTTAPAAAGAPAEFTDRGSSSENQTIRHWKPGHGDSKSSRAWFAAMKHQETAPLTKNFYSATDGDCLESIARRQLREEHKATDSHSTQADVNHLIALNKNHYKSLTVNPHYIQKGWTLRLSEPTADTTLNTALNLTPRATAPDASSPSAKPLEGAAAENALVKRGPGAHQPPLPRESTPALGDRTGDKPQDKSGEKPGEKVEDKPGSKPGDKAGEQPRNNSPANSGSPTDHDTSKNAPPKTEGLIGNIYSFGKEIVDDTKQLGHDHPLLLEIGGALGAAAILIASRGKLDRLFGAEKELSATTRMLEREGILARVGVIPDVERPQISSLLPFAESGEQSDFQSAAVAYRSSLFKLKHQLPTHYLLGETETVPELAKRALTDRVPITGERVSDEAIATEAKRIKSLNPDIGKNSNQRLLVHDAPTLGALADTSIYKHVPQIGQLLKQHGVSEENMQDALRIQSSLPAENRPLIGQVLVDAKLATRAQVDQAFEQQNALKALLKSVRDDIFGK